MLRIDVELTPYTTTQQPADMKDRRGIQHPAASPAAAVVDDDKKKQKQQQQRQEKENLRNKTTHL